MHTSSELEKGKFLNSILYSLDANTTLSPLHYTWLLTDYIEMVSPLNLILFRVVEYANYDDMRNALRKPDGAELNGRRLKLTEDYRGSRRRR